MILSRAVRRFWCNHKGTTLTIPFFKNLFTMELLKEDTTCLRCGKLIKRSMSVVERRKRVVKFLWRSLCVFGVATVVVVLVFFLMVCFDVVNFCSLHRPACQSFIK